MNKPCYPECVGFVPPTTSEFATPIAIVGEAPATEEVKQGKPFVGQSGKLLWSVMTQLNVQREECHVTNATLCQSGRDCSARLGRELAEVKPRVIIALGGSAISAIMRSEVAVAKARFMPLVTTEGVPVFATYHPAYLLQYMPDLLPDLVSDLERALANKHPRMPQCKMALVNTRQGWELLKPLLGDSISIDIETTGLNPRRDKILCISLGWGDGHTAVLDVDAYPPLYGLLNDILLDKRQIYHNGKFDIQFLHAAGVCNTIINEDTLLLSYIMDERKGTHDLKYLACRYLGYRDYSIALDEYTPRKDLHVYAARDAHCTHEMCKTLYQGLDDSDSKAYILLLKAVTPLSEMEKRGIMVDTVAAALHLERVEAEMSEIQSKLPFNPASPQQVVEEFPILAALSTKERKIWLSRLAEYSEEAKLVIEFRTLQSFARTHLAGVLNAVEQDGRVHPTYQMHSAETGRITSQNPNALNIPKDEAMRGIFIAAPGHKLISADYNQHEFRVAAVLSGDESMCEAYIRGEDIHYRTAADLFGEGQAHDKIVRRDAKAINFGLLYMMGTQTLALRLDISKEKAASYRERFLELRPQYFKWVRVQQELIHTQGYVQTVFGRRRRFPLLTSSNVHHAEREAANMLVQSTAADLTLLALIEMFPKVTALGAHPIILVYDSIVVECPDDVIDNVIDIINNIMLRVPATHLHTNVPWKVDIEVSDKWS